MFRQLRPAGLCCLQAMLLVAAVGSLATAAEASAVEHRPNIIFILTDDQRYDELGFLNPDLQTPNIDRLAKGGVHFKNAFVTTSLCSPSRASILTGLYAHAHGVVDNLKQELQPGIRFFPQDLQDDGYETAYIGKWHMGLHSDKRQPGFDHWVSFAGQGNYLPTDGSPINVNGKRVPQQGYITDELTDYAMEWLDQRKGSAPFFLYLSHKAVHANFTPAERHRELYADVSIELPGTAAETPEAIKNKPMWVRNQRNSWHGVDFAYHSDLDIREYRREYRRSLAAVDDSVGRILDWVAARGIAENTIVVFMGDNGFMFGEHGLIDKRNAYEASMRVPLLVYAPTRFRGGTVVDSMIANIDIAPTLLSWAEVTVSRPMHGRDFTALANGDDVNDWRDEIYYEYFWNWVFPQTPTVFALRTSNFKLIQYHGIWDTDELYNMRTDPEERINLIGDPDYKDTVRRMRARLYQLNLETGGTPEIRYTIKEGPGIRFRTPRGADQAKFPESIYRQPNPDDPENYKD